MDDSEKPSLPPSLRDLIEQERRRLGPHPPVEDLVAYQAGELPAEQEERLRDHVALCRECAQLLLDLRDFPDISLPEGAPRPTPAEVEAAWEALQPRLKEPGPAAVPALQPAEALPAPVPPPRPPERKPAPARWLAPLAAVFFLSTIGLSFWGISLQRKVSELRQPWSPENVDLEIERSVGQERVISAVKGHALRFSIQEEGEDYSGYELSIEQAQTREEVFRGPLQDLTLTLPPHALSPGLYRLTLYGLQDGQPPERLQQFTLRVRPK